MRWAKTVEGGDPLGPAAVPYPVSPPHYTAVLKNPSIGFQ